jgi:hypothetical protein
VTPPMCGLVLVPCPLILAEKRWRGVMGLCSDDGVSVSVSVSVSMCVRVAPPHSRVPAAAASHRRGESFSMSNRAPAVDHAIGR